MKSITVDDGNRGQRLNKFCKRILPAAPDSFIYKMLRKKNITLNGKKAEGNELLSTGDEVKFFLSDETFLKMSGDEDTVKSENPAEEIPPIEKARIIYEDDNILVCHKNAGELSQKAAPEDISINERIVSYLSVSSDFTPGVCNRLDRNTEGLVIAGKNLHAQAAIGNILKDHSLEKYYLALVAGKFTTRVHLKLYLTKDHKTNTVTISDTPSENSVFTESVVYPEKPGDEFSVVKVRLLTGKSHQIRAHLAHIGFPIAGDPKYGKREINRKSEKLYKNMKSGQQFLIAYELKFPVDFNELPGLCGKSVKDSLPSWYQR